AHIAVGKYDDQGKADYAGALKAFAVALKPNDAGALTAQGYVQRRVGNVAAALLSLEQAFALDPRDSSLAVILAQTYLMAGRYPDAEAALQRALAIDPHNLQAKLYYAQALIWGSGDVAGALAAAQGDVPALKLMRVWLLTLQRKYSDALALLDSVPDTPDNFSAQSGSKALQQADLYRFMHDPAKARPLYRQALAAAQKELPRQQGILQAYVWQNIADAELGLGQTQKGLQAIAQSLVVVDQSGDRVYGNMLMADASGLYGQAGRADLAVPLLDKALAMYPGSRPVSGLWLWLAPQMDPIRHDPRFQALQKQYAKYKPAVTYDAAPAS
ncbi:MAG: tetratricopeptide repeat protein, partial [Bryobacteraceae bacterium]